MHKYVDLLYSVDQMTWGHVLILGLKMFLLSFFVSVAMILALLLFGHFVLGSPLV